MTEEEATKLIELMEEYNKIELYSTILVAIFILALCVWCVLTVIKFLNEKKHYTEWKATLTDEQLQAVNKAKELMK